MSNLLGYICIAVISWIITAHAIYKKKDIYKISTLIMFFLFSASITWIGEFTVLGLFNAYAYKTDLIQDPWAQNIIGHLLLNTSMFPAAATVMVAYSFRYRMIALTAVIFVVIEYIFVKLGFYEKHWWTYTLSAINVVIFMLIAKKWFSKICRGCSGLIRIITFYFIGLIIIHIATPILLLSGQQHYHIGLIDNLVNNYYHSSTIIAFIDHLIQTCVIIFFVCVLKKWYWKIVPFIISLILPIIYVKINILSIHDGWNLIYTLLIQQICLAIFILAEKYTLLPDLYRLKRDR